MVDLVLNLLLAFEKLQTVRQLFRLSCFGLFLAVRRLSAPRYSDLASARLLVAAAATWGLELDWDANAPNHEGAAAAAISAASGET